MRIDLKKFFSNDDVLVNIDYSFDMKDAEVDGFKPFISPIKVKGTIESFAGAADLKAQLNFDYSMPCNRCMEETLSKQNFSVSHTLVSALNSEEDNDSYIQVEGEAIDLDELFYSDIILEMSVKYICKEDCKGICPMCGVNLNEKSCNCSKSQVDPRLEILKQLIDN